MLGFGKFKLSCVNFSCKSRIIWQKSLTGLDICYLSKFKIETLHGYNLIAHNKIDYKLINKPNLTISKKGCLNTMYGKRHS